MAKAKKQPNKQGVKNVEICAAILSDKPPQLPLREELQSLGFEVVLGASGTGIKASKYESRRAVKAYRKDIELQDLRKRRIFPKSPRRIKEKIDSRRRIEQALSLPHACSYESYEIKLQRSRASAPLPYDVDFSTSSSSGRDEMFYTGVHPLSNDDDPLFLTTSEDNEDCRQRNLNKLGTMEVFDIPDVFGAFDDLDESSRVSTDIFCSDNDKYPSGGETNVNTNSTNPFDSCEEAEEKKEDGRDGMGSIQSAGRSSEQGSIQRSGDHNSIQSATRSAERSSIQSARRSAEQGPIQSATRSAKHNIEKERHKEDQEVAQLQDDSDPIATKTSEENDCPSVERKPVIPTSPAERGSLDSLRAPRSAHEDQHIQNTDKEEQALREEGLTHTEPVTGEERTSLPLRRAEPSQTIVESTPKLSVSWMSSAKNALESLSSEVFKVTTCDKRSGGLSDSIAEDPLSALFRLLSEPDLRLDRIESILADRPELPQVKQSQGGRLPLHTLCDRKMPRRGRGVRTLSTELLLEDIREYRKAIAMLVGFSPDSCFSFDEKNDLPVHLAARNLMVWEATWYESVYRVAATETDGSGHAAAMVTDLYHAMSETIECLLTPMLGAGIDAEVCKAPGSMGTILPIHVASIFTTSVRTLRLLLEKHPKGATIQCDLGILQTFVPDECLALELHDNLSTDFPKWEINPVDQGSFRKEKADEDTILRSDLLFAYNPIDPHRFEKDRIRRFESRIQFDATTVIVKNPPRLDSSNGRIWQWMCTYQEPETGRSTYLSSVKRIVSVLTYQPLQLLASMETFRGKRLIDEANSDCAKIIKKRLSDLQDDIAVRKFSIEEGITPIPVADAVLAGKSTVERLGRLIFNLPQDQLPLSFVILPYELRKKKDGSFGLVTPNDSNLARKFAGFLVAFTDPETILEMLHNKWYRYYGQSIFGSKVKNQPSYGSLAVLTESLLGLYNEAGCAYFYLVKDETGLPEVEETNSVFRLDNPAEVVTQLLPLMMLGMVQMRGDSAVFRWTSVMSNRDIVAIPPTWRDAAVALETYLVDTNQVKAAEDRAYLEEVIRKFRSLSLHDIMNNKQSGGEWMEEIAVLKTVLNQDAKINTSRTKHVVVDRDKTLIDLVNYPDELIPSQRVSSPEVIDLTRKMDQLSRIFDLDLYANGSVRRREEVVEQEDKELPAWTSDKGMQISELPNTTKKRYSPLFAGLPIDKPCSSKEARDENGEQTGIRVWNSVNQVWEDVRLQLFTRGEKFIDDPELLELKVNLHDQAKKLIDLRDQVSHLNQSERVISGDPVEVFDLTNITDSKSSCCATDSSLSEARNLVIRMGDLEDRLVCNEIEIQHLSMEAYSVEHEGIALLETSQEQPIPARRQGSHGTTAEANGARSEFEDAGTCSVSCSSTDRGKRSWGSSPIKSVRFEERSDQSGVVELETSSSSCTVSQIAISRRPISNKPPESVALDAATQYSPDFPRTHGSDQHPFFVPQVLSFDRTGISLPDSARDISSMFEANRGGEIQPPSLGGPPHQPQTFCQDSTDFINGPFDSQSDDSGNRAVVETEIQKSTEKTSSGKESMMTVAGQPSSCSSVGNWRGDCESDCDNPQRAASCLSLEHQNSKCMSTSQGTFATVAPFDGLPEQLIPSNPPLIVSCSPTSNMSPTLQSRAQRLSARRKRIRSLKSRCSYGSSSASAESSRPAVRLRIDDAKDLSTSADGTTISSNQSVFRPQTINVPQSLPDREFSGLSVSRSFSNNELANEIDNLILRYTE